MKFALNYSPQAAALLAAGRFDIDLYKCADWDDMIATARGQRPVYVHFPLMTGCGHDYDLERVAHLRADTGTPFVNVHLTACATPHDIPLESTDAAHSAQMFALMLEDVCRVTARFGGQNVILENVPWDPEYDIPRLALYPEFVTGLIESSGGGLLLDLAHAAIAAQHLGMDVRAYIEKLPLYRLRELHVTGTFNDNGYWRDHFPMRDEDWALYEWALANIRAGRWAEPQIVACEYGGIGPLFEWRSKSEVLETDIPRMIAALRTPVLNR
ncbi:MAG: DUF692 family protein [Chloroflexi bacterium]|nr:DUF692 family protein [Chloroflexota bacterium]